MTKDPDVIALKKDVEFIRYNLTDFVRRLEFEPVKTIVYGMVGLILTAFLLGVIKWVIAK